MGNGVFIISLDFELGWGQLDQKNFERYTKNIYSVYEVIPSILQSFSKHLIHATWATVGMIAAKDKDELQEYLPHNFNELKINQKSSYYYYDKRIDCRLLFAPQLIELIMNTKNQEIGSHTFSHYYSNESFSNVEDFKNDILCSLRIFKKKFNIEVKSLVLPRNQVNIKYLNALYDTSISCFRSNPNHGYKQSKSKIVNSINKILRLTDSYFPLFKNTFKHVGMTQSEIVGINSSRFLRPYSSKLAFLEKAKIRRIKKEMKFAAKKKEVYHLWWHPHNFGKNMNIMIEQLNEILDYYDFLKEKYGFCSMNMNEYSKVR